MKTPKKTKHMWKRRGEDAGEEDRDYYSMNKAPKHNI
jgi:hypothetical protein